MINNPRYVKEEYKKIQEFKDGLSTIAAIVLVVFAIGVWFAGSKWNPRIYDSLLILFIGVLVVRIYAFIQSERLRAEVLAVEDVENLNEKLKEEAKEQREMKAAMKMSPEEMEKKYGIRPKHTVKENKSKNTDKKIIKFPKR